MDPCPLSSALSQQMLMLRKFSSYLGFPTRAVRQTVSFPSCTSGCPTPCPPRPATKTLPRRVSLPSTANPIIATMMPNQKEFLPLCSQGHWTPPEPPEDETLTCHYSQIANHQTLCGSSPPPIPIPPGLAAFSASVGSPSNDLT